LIIACPECTSPFQVLDGQIAALLQIECPTCTFRMILDFQAANDASLREAGMGMAQGFRDEAAYRQAVGAGGCAWLRRPCPSPSPHGNPSRPRRPRPRPSSRNRKHSPSPRAASRPFALARR
jgi:hypothetical protein